MRFFFLLVDDTRISQNVVDMLMCAILNGHRCEDFYSRSWMRRCDYMQFAFLYALIDWSFVEQIKFSRFVCCHWHRSVCVIVSFASIYDYYGITDAKSDNQNSGTMCVTMLSHAYDFQIYDFSVFSHFRRISFSLCFFSKYFILPHNRKIVHFSIFNTHFDAHFSVRQWHSMHVYAKEKYHKFMSMFGSLSMSFDFRYKSLSVWHTRKYV